MYFDTNLKFSDSKSVRFHEPSNHPPLFLIVSLPISDRQSRRLIPRYLSLLETRSFYMVNNSVGITRRLARGRI